VTQVDIVVLAILALMLLRGLWIGLVRELASLGAIAAALVGTRLFAGPAGAWLAERSGLTPWVGTGIALVAIGVGILAICAIIGHFAKRGINAVGLGGVDRLCGAVLGSAEGALVAALLLFVAAFWLGRDDPLLERSRSFAIFQQLERWATEEVGAIDVAAEPPRRVD